MKHFKITTEKRKVVFKIKNEDIFEHLMFRKYVHIYLPDGSIKPTVCQKNYEKPCSICDEISKINLVNKDFNFIRKMRRREKYRCVITILEDSKNEFEPNEDVFFTSSTNFINCVMQYSMHHSFELDEPKVILNIRPRKIKDVSLPEYHGISKIDINGTIVPLFMPDDYMQKSLSEELRDLFRDNCDKNKKIGIGKFVKIVREFIEQ